LEQRSKEEWVIPQLDRFDTGVMSVPTQRALTLLGSSSIAASSSR
jgi:hypothetical protein